MSEKSWGQQPSSDLPNQRPDFGRPEQWDAPGGAAEADRGHPAQPSPGQAYGQPWPNQPVPQAPADPFAGWAPPSVPPARATPAPARRRQARPIRLRRGAPVVTLGLIGTCVLIWLAQMSTPLLLRKIALTPTLGYSQPWRLLTSAFAHSYSPLHIMFNMYALWVLGRSLELALGRARFIALYLLSAFGGSVAFIAIAALTHDWSVSVVGASGAVFGLFGALLPIQRQIGASSNQLYGILAINFAIGFSVPGIAWQAHLGGFLTGLACGWLMMRAVNESRRGKADRTWQYLGGLLAVLVGGYAAIFALGGLAI